MSAAPTRFPAQGEAWAAMVIAGAMGARRDFYAPLARFFARHGIHVVTFDYEGMGAARPPRMRDVRADVMAWAQRDLDPMLDEARSMAPSLPLLFLGHSLGGQLLGVLQGNTGVAAAVTVTAGSGWYRLNDRMPIQVRILWFAAIPLLTPLFGYFPGKRLRVVGDLPANVAWQWRRWCLHPDYLLVESGAREAFARVAAPILAFSIEDDSLITRPAVDALHAAFRGARVERRHVVPAQMGVERIGHFGFFSEASETSLWADSLEWLRRRAAAS